MDIGQLTERAAGMNEKIWMRHANPLSGWTRLWTAPFLFFSLWGYFWFGWKSLIFFAVLCLWLWINPRIFPKPKSAGAWMTKGVLGERVWLNRKNVPIPKGFALAAIILSSLSGGMLLLSIAGFVLRDFWLAFLAWHFSSMLKIWFVDRMVWLWEVMKDSEAQYQAWEKELSGA